MPTPESAHCRRVYPAKAPLSGPIIIVFINWNKKEATVGKGKKETRPARMALNLKRAVAY
jgi:hypothetical protein